MSNVKVGKVQCRLCSKQMTYSVYQPMGCIGHSNTHAVPCRRKECMTICWPPTSAVSATSIYIYIYIYFPKVCVSACAMHVIGQLRSAGRGPAGPDYWAGLRQRDRRAEPKSSIARFRLVNNAACNLVVLRLPLSTTGA